MLELGAGAGLPSLISGINGARAVVVTDYPDPELIENLNVNIEGCASLPEGSRIYAAGYLWGADTAELQRLVPETEQEGGFDLLILADLLFNHSEHAKLLKSIQRTLKHTSNAQALVFFTPYRPWLFDKDLAFFDLAKEGGFVVEKILEHVMDKVMFDEDPGVSRLASTGTQVLIMPGRAFTEDSVRLSSKVDAMSSGGSFETCCTASAMPSRYLQRRLMVSNVSLAVSRPRRRILRGQPLSSGTRSCVNVSLYPALTLPVRCSMISPKPSE